MKIGIFNRETMSLDTFTTMTDAAKFIGKSSKTLGRWQAERASKVFKQFVVCFEVTEHRCKSKNKGGSFR